MAFKAEWKKKILAKLPIFLHSQKGFILPTTLFILAAILIAASWYGSWTAEMLSKAKTQSVYVQFRKDAQSTFSLVMHRIALSRSSPRGVFLEIDQTKSPELMDEEVVGNREFIFDDRCYKGVGEVQFSVQDENGLIGVNFFSKEQLGSLLSLMGVALQKQGPLIDKLQDYLDADDLLHLNGAEAKEYERAKKPGPANALLLNSYELYNVLDWDLPLLWEDSDFRRLITVATLGYPNFNTAPKLALMTTPTINDALASTIVEKRKQRGYVSLSSVEAAIGLSLGIDPLGLAFFSGRYLRISIWHPGLNLMQEVHVYLTPTAEKQQPWFIDYEVTVSRPLEGALNTCETIEEIFPH